MCFNVSAHRMKLNRTGRVPKRDVAADSSGFDRSLHALQIQIPGLSVGGHRAYINHLDVAIACLQAHSRAARHVELNVGVSRTWTRPVWRSIPEQHRDLFCRNRLAVTSETSKLNCVNIVRARSHFVP